MYQWGLASQTGCYNLHPGWVRLQGSTPPGVVDREGTKVAQGPDRGVTVSKKGVLRRIWGRCLQDYRREHDIACLRNKNSSSPRGYVLAIYIRNSNYLCCRSCVCQDPRRPGAGSLHECVRTRGPESPASGWQKNPHCKCEWSVSSGLILTTTINSLTVRRHLIVDSMVVWMQDVIASGGQMTFWYLTCNTNLAL